MKISKIKTEELAQKEWEKEFDKEMVEPDITNAGRNSPKMWMFEGYISAKKEAKSFIRFLLSSHTSSVLEEIVKDLEKEKRESWKYSGGGGFDTEAWCLGGRCIDFPGIKQIAFYGIRNEIWWAKYLFRQQVIKPESIKVEGFNQALDLVIKKIKEINN